MRNKSRLAGLFVALFVALSALAFTSTAAQAAPASYDLPWTNDMNKASYWNSYFANDSRTVSCTKYEKHSGHIPAEYDAAVTKKGSSVVRVYADLTSTGAFNATHPQGQPPMSWVMKCKFTPKTTTTTTQPPEDTTTTTQPPEDTTTTTQPVTTQPPTTEPPATTQPPAVTTTEPPVVTTTPPQPETTVVVATDIPPVPPTVPPAGLPATGTNNGLLLLIAAGMLGAGLLATRVARRTPIN